MIGKDDVRDFLMSRRANVTPGQAGLPQDGGDRRVPGLRREEVAMLAGVSTDYYTRLERGDIGNASRSVLEGIARALQLDDVERDHLFDLARNATSDATGHDDTPRSGSVRESVQRLLDNMQVPAVVYNAHQDLVAANLLGRALFAPIFETERPNLARFIFLDSRAPDFYEDWPLACSLTAAMLRFEAGRDPLNEELTALIGELSTRSPQFRRHWADRDVHEHRTGQKTYRHPEVATSRSATRCSRAPANPASRSPPTPQRRALLPPTS
jgi:transcriptional regulator with XRE-family HTH domain